MELTQEQLATADRKFPPITELTMASIALVAAGVIWLAGHFPNRPSLIPSIVLLVLADALLALAAVWLARERDFAWWRFWQVARWTLLAYVVIAGMIEFAFLYDHMRGSTLAVMTLLLATFMFNVPLVLGFTVARFEEARQRPQ